MQETCGHFRADGISSDSGKYQTEYINDDRDRDCRQKENDWPDSAGQCQIAKKRTKRQQGGQASQGRCKPR